MGNILSTFVVRKKFESETIEAYVQEQINDFHLHLRREAFDLSVEVIPTINTSAAGDYDVNFGAFQRFHMLAIVASSDDTYTTNITLKSTSRNNNRSGDMCVIHISTLDAGTHTVNVMNDDSDTLYTNAFGDGDAGVFIHVITNNDQWRV